jgi:gluconokinase
MSRYVIMGVSGCGKSRVGLGFATVIGTLFIDGDSLHPQSNINKMRGGEPLNDIDRAPWLVAVGTALKAKGTVVACSALKRAYRDLIRQTAGAPVTFLYLRGQRETLLQRMSTRPGHFMPPALLDSQCATLEPPMADERHLVADIEQTPEAIIALFLAGLSEIAPRA